MLLILLIFNFLGYEHKYVYRLIRYGKLNIYDYPSVEIEEKSLKAIV